MNRSSEDEDIYRRWAVFCSSSHCFDYRFTFVATASAAADSESPLPDSYIHYREALNSFIKFLTSNELKIKHEQLRSEHKTTLCARMSSRSSSTQCAPLRSVISIMPRYARCDASCLRSVYKYCTASLEYLYTSIVSIYVHGVLEVLQQQQQLH
ncbi:unnamed protein product [Trichogramma brassicae]|uniref:Uncharacterized protein n=1 Tax=Trichogramma brassicae TaxID=86971 RepID=A0A6H5IKX1_9HYME|nr:unnamed protein product [Trichogramma brassicae]